VFIWQPKEAAYDLNDIAPLKHNARTLAFPATATM
jgi:hypothetical protein